MGVWVGVRRVVSGAGFAVMLAATGLWLAEAVAGRVPAEPLPAAGMYLHVWLTILDGGWTGLRRVTWLLFGLGGFGAVAAGFAGYVLPWGQLEFWFADQVGAGAAAWVFGLAGGAVLFTVLTFLADVAVAAVLRMRGRPAWQAVAVLGAAVALAVLASLAVPAPPVPEDTSGLLTPAEIVPRWYMLPWFAMLRSSPNKLLGLVLAAAAVLLPMGAPWIRAERFRSGVAWPLLCLALLADFAALGWFGAQPPEAGVILGSQVLTAGWFAFFLLAAPLLRRNRPLSPG